MSATELKSQLHKIIDKVTDKSILEAMHTLLSAQMNVYGHSTSGKPISKNELDRMLNVSEEEIKTGKTTTARDLKKEIQSWRKK